MIMKKILLFAVVIFTMAFGGGDCSAESTLGCVTVLGDSIATGYGLPDYVEGNNYSAPFSWGNLLSQECKYYENYAVDGLTSEGLYELLSKPSRALQKSLERSDCIIISIGGNDFLEEIKNSATSSALTDRELLSALMNGTLDTQTVVGYTDRILKNVTETIEKTDIEKTVANLEECIKVINEVNPGVDIMLFTIYNPFSEHILLSGISDSVEGVLTQFNDRIAKISKKYDNVRIADVHSALSDNVSEFTNINRFDIHPSEAGHNRIYEWVSGMMKQR